MTPPENEILEAIKIEIAPYTTKWNNIRYTKAPYPSLTFFNSQCNEGNLAIGWQNNWLTITIGPDTLQVITHKGVFLYSENQSTRHNLDYNDPKLIDHLITIITEYNNNHSS